jgi:hypothetical protein
MNETLQLESNKTQRERISGLNFVKRLYRLSYVLGVWNNVQEK